MAYRSLRLRVCAHFAALEDRRSRAARWALITRSAMAVLSGTMACPIGAIGRVSRLRARAGERHLRDSQLADVTALREDAQARD